MVLQLSNTSGEYDSNLGSVMDKLSLGLCDFAHVRRKEIKSTEECFQLKQEHCESKHDL